MANKKLTDLTELTTPADNDFLYVVDVSDTTESPQGTSKKIRKDKVDSGASKENIANKSDIYTTDTEKYYSAAYVNGVLPTSYSKIVYVNATSPITATIFDTENPPVTNDNLLKNDVANLYIGTDASTWVYNSTTYITKSVTATSSNFYLAGTTTDAGNTKTGHISRIGNINTTGKLGVLGSSYFATDTDAKLYIGTSTLNPSNSKFVTKGTLSASNHLASFLNNSGVEQVNILNDGTINSKSIVSDHISVLGNSASLTFNGTNAGIGGTSGKYLLNRASNWELIGLLKYATDVSVSYDARTLVDKGYTDAKITQTITNGVTDKSPSEDVVYDAIDGVVKTIILDTPTSTLTGTVTETLMHTYTIAGGKLPTSCMPNLKIRCSKTGSAGTCTIRVKVNSVNDFATASTVALYVGASNVMNFITVRNPTLSAGVMINNNKDTSILSDELTASTAAFTSTTYDPSVTRYWFISLQNSDSTDTTRVRSVKLTN